MSCQHTLGWCKVSKKVDEVWVILPSEQADLDNPVAALDEENAQDQWVELHIKIVKLLLLVTMMTKTILKLASFVQVFSF